MTILTIYFSSTVVKTLSRKCLAVVFFIYVIVLNEKKSENVHYLRRYYPYSTRHYNQGLK